MNPTTTGYFPPAPAPMTPAQSAAACSGPPPEPKLEYQEAVDQVAAAVKKLVDAGLGATCAAETAVKLWSACCRRSY